MSQVKSRLEIFFEAFRLRFTATSVKMSAVGSAVEAVDPHQGSHGTMKIEKVKHLFLSPAKAADRWCPDRKEGCLTGSREEISKTVAT